MLLLQDYDVAGQGRAPPQAPPSAASMPPLRQRCQQQLPPNLQHQGPQQQDPQHQGLEHGSQRPLVVEALLKRSSDVPSGGRVFGMPPELLAGRCASERSGHEGAGRVGGQGLGRAWEAVSLGRCCCA